MNDTSTFPLVTIPTPSLRERSVDVSREELSTPEFQAFLDKLIRTMFVEDGIGIAASQVGRNVRAIVVNLKREGATVFINPEITKSSEASAEDIEGCLSVPGKSGLVRRSKRVSVRALNRHGRSVELDVSGLYAVVFQHEIDHINGVLYIDRATEIYDHNSAAAI